MLFLLPVNTFESNRFITLYVCLEYLIEDSIVLFFNDFMLWFRTRVIKISPQNKFPSTFLCGNFRDLKNLRFHFHLGIIRGFEEFRVHQECDSLFKENVTFSCLQSAQQPNSLFHHHVNLNFTPLRICSLKLDNY